MRLEADSDSEDEAPSTSTQGRWSSKNPGLVGSRIPKFNKPVMSAEDKEKLEGLSAALDYYKLFQPDSYVHKV